VAVAAFCDITERAIMSIATRRTTARGADNVVRRQWRCRSSGGWKTKSL